MNLISLSIRRPVFAWILMSAFIIFGTIAFFRLGVSQLPDVDFPVLSISVNYDGASPEVVESELIDPMEQSLLSIEGVLNMTSSVRQGSGSITLDFAMDRNVDVALQEVQTALGGLRYPMNVDPPTVKKRNPEEQPIMFIGVSTQKPLRETLIWVNDFLLDQFRFLPKIGEVSISGFSTRNIRVWPDFERLKRADLTVVDLLDALQTQHLETSAGQFEQDKKEYRVRWLGEASTTAEIEDIRILRRGGQVIQDRVYRIKDVAKIEDGLSDVRRVARINGQEAIAISIQKQRGSNEVELSEIVTQRVLELQKKIPSYYDLQINVDFTKPTRAVVLTTQEKLLVAALVTVLVCFLFLGSWSAAVNILFSIPTSIVGTLIIVYFCGFTLNLFTLLALTLSISIVVDDAIMLLENIVRHRRMGKDAFQAAYDGSMEILPAAVAATLAVVAVFVPVVFMSGITGKFFFQFGVTMSAAVLLSLVEAVTITPMRAAALMKGPPQNSVFEDRLEHFFDKLQAAYMKVLSKTLPLSYWVVAGSIFLFVASLFLVRNVKQELVPAQDQNIIFASGQMAPGTSLQETSKKVLEIETVLKSYPYIERYFVTIGAGPGVSSVSQFAIPITLVDREKRNLGHLEIMSELREKTKVVPGVRLSFRDVSSRGLTSGRPNPVSFNLSGPNLEVLQSSAEKISAQLESEMMAVDMDTNFKLGLPELLIRPQRDLMAEKGVSVEVVARTLGATVAGIRQSQFTSNGRRYDIRLKLPPEALKSKADLGAIEVRNNFGLRLPLSDLVTFDEHSTYQSITRVNRQRSIGVYGNLAPQVGQGAALQRAAELAKNTLPDGYSFNLEGSSAGLAEGFRSLLIALIMGILVAYMVLAVQFNSFVHPVSVLVALPFSISGAILVLWLFGVSLNLFSFIGIIVLMGIAKKNSILLVEFTNQVREKEKSQDVMKSLLEACPVRLRPILMTSVATLAAAIPLVVGNSMGHETRLPMGLTIIGGTLISTLFTLVVVPSIYKILSSLESRS